MIVRTFTTFFVGQRDFISSTTICIKEFCIYDRYVRFLFLCLISFSRFTASFSRIEWARSHTMLKMRANPGSSKSHDTFFCFVLVCFPKSSYLPVFCVYFYCYSALSWGFHTLNHPSHKNFILES